MKAICILCRKPDRIWCEFLNTFAKYKVFLMIDSFDFDTSEIEEIYQNLSFIKISDDTCREYNYTNINYFVEKEVTSWEKAILYFQHFNKNFDHVWFIEDDVFFYDENVISKIDEQYKDEDFLSRRPFNIGEKKEKWGPIDSKFKEPFYSAMCCAVRMSKNMLNQIDNFRKDVKRFCFLEILFPTIAINLNLNYKNPPELISVLFNPDMSIKKKVFTDVLYTNLFHPVKDIYKHKIYREGILH